MDENKKIKKELKDFTNSMDYLLKSLPILMTKSNKEFSKSFGEAIIKREVNGDFETEEDLQEFARELRKFIKKIESLISLTILSTDIYFKSIKTEDDENTDFSDTLELDYYDITKTARVLEVSRPTIYKWIKENYLGLKTVKKGAKEVITKKELIRFHTLYTSK